MKYYYEEHNKIMISLLCSSPTTIDCTLDSSSTIHTLCTYQLTRDDQRIYHNDWKSVKRTTHQDNLLETRQTDNSREKARQQRQQPEVGEAVLVAVDRERIENEESSILRPILVLSNRSFLNGQHHRNGRLKML
jgi:hypothetical protein